MIVIKSKEEIDILRVPCKVTGELLNALEDYIRPGLSTYDVVVTDDNGKIISKMVVEFYNLRIDFDDYVNNMIHHETDLYFDKNVFGEDKVEAKTFGLLDK